MAMATAIIVTVGIWSDGARPGIGDGVSIIVAACWVAGAIGLFFRSRLAWCGSLLGAGSLLAYGTMLMVVPFLLRLETSAIIVVFGLFFVFVSGVLIIRLVRLRRVLFYARSSG